MANSYHTNIHTRKIITENVIFQFVQSKKNMSIITIDNNNASGYVIFLTSGREIPNLTLLSL